MKLNKTAFSVGSLDDEPDDKKYWLAQKAAERVYAIETMRQIIYGYNPSTTRLQRFFEVAELK